MGGHGGRGDRAGTAWPTCRLFSSLRSAMTNSQRSIQTALPSSPSPRTRKARARRTAPYTLEGRSEASAALGIGLPPREGRRRPRRVRHSSPTAQERGIHRNSPPQVGRLSRIRPCKPNMSMPRPPRVLVIGLRPLIRLPCAGKSRTTPRRQSRSQWQVYPPGFLRR